MNKKVLCFTLMVFFGFIFLSKTNAQQVDGKWYGIAVVENDESSNSFMCELVLETKKNNKIEGYFNYYFRNGYFTNKVSGSFNPKTRELSLNTFPVLYYRTVNIQTGIDCNMLASLFLRISRVESSLNGYFYSKEHAYTCPELKVRLTKQVNDLEIEKLETHFAKEEVMEKQGAVPKPIDPEVNLRRKELVRILDVVEDSVLIELYDNGDFDHDSISLYHNGIAIVDKQLLETRKPIRFKIGVDNDELKNELIMFAENLGTIPPNAALMIITDKNNRYEIHLESNYIKNAAIRLRKKAKAKQAL